MKHTMLAAAAALLLVGPNARAATFDLSVIGSGTHWHVAEATFVDETWLGDLSVQTISDADGTYVTGAGLVSLTFSSNFDSFSYRDGDQQHRVYPQFDGGPSYLAGLVPGTSVTIAGGQVVAVDGSFVWDGCGSLDFSGLSVSDLDGGQAGQPNADYWQMTGVLSSAAAPAATPAPEPATWLLLTLGLAITRIARCAGRCWPARWGTR